MVWELPLISYLDGIFITLIKRVDFFVYKSGGGGVPSDGNEFGITNVTSQGRVSITVVPPRASMPRSRSQTPFDHDYVGPASQYGSGSEVFCEDSAVRGRGHPMCSITRGSEAGSSYSLSSRGSASSYNSHTPSYPRADPSITDRSTVSSSAHSHRLAEMQRHRQELIAQGDSRTATVSRIRVRVKWLAWPISRCLNE